MIDGNEKVFRNLKRFNMAMFAVHIAQVFAGTLRPA